MLFDVRPKESRKDLYDRDKEVDEIKESIDRKVMDCCLRNEESRKDQRS